MRPSRDTDRLRALLPLGSVFLYEPFDESARLQGLCWMIINGKRPVPKVVPERGGGGRAFILSLDQRLPEKKPLDLQPPFDWSVKTFSRSRKALVHKWAFADFLLAEAIQRDNPIAIQELLAIAADYYQYFDSKNSNDTRDPLVRSGSAAKAARGSKLALLRAASKRFGFDFSDELEQALLNEFRSAVRSEEYEWNNHGVMTDAAILLSVINLPTLHEHFELARVLARMRENLLERQLTPEFIHKEHTPSYAVLWVVLAEKMVVLLERVKRDWEISGLIEEIQEAISAVVLNLEWFLTPTGSFFNFGEMVNHVLPGGKHIRLPDGLSKFDDSGYAFAREGESHIGLLSAYHKTKKDKVGYASATHKQRDELSVVWSEKQGEILVDTGFSDYEFDEKRSWLQTKLAHNAIAFLDSEPSDFRSRSNYMSDTGEPFGSGIIGGRDLSEGWYSLAGYEPILLRKQILHIRVLVLASERGVVVVDAIRVMRPENVRWAFHMGPNWDGLPGSRHGQFLLSNSKFESNLQFDQATTGVSAEIHWSLNHGRDNHPAGWSFSPDIPLTYLIGTAFLGPGLHVFCNLFTWNHSRSDFDVPRPGLRVKFSEHDLAIQLVIDNQTRRWSHGLPSVLEAVVAS